MIRRYTKHVCKTIIVLNLFICHMQLSSTGGRLIISSDGVWDALSAETAFECCRGMPPDAAASQIVKVFIINFFIFHIVIVVYLLI